MAQGTRLKNKDGVCGMRYEVRGKWFSRGIFYPVPCTLKGINALSPVPLASANEKSSRETPTAFFEALTVFCKNILFTGHSL